MFTISVGLHFSFLVVSLSGFGIKAVSYDVFLPFQFFGRIW